MRGFVPTPPTRAAPLHPAFFWIEDPHWLASELGLQRSLSDFSQVLSSMLTNVECKIDYI